MTTTQSQNMVYITTRDTVISFVEKVKRSSRKYMETETISCGYSEGIIYRRVKMNTDLIKVTGNELQVTQRAVKKIVQLKQAKAELDALEAELKKQAVEKMEECGIKKFTTDGLTMTYKDSYERTTFDSKALRCDNPKVYNKYTKTSMVKPSVVIKVD